MWGTLNPKPWVSRALPCSELQKCLAGLAGLCRANPNIPTRRYPEIPSHASLVAFLPTCGVCGALRSWVFVVSCESEYLWVLLCICSDPFGKFFERFWTYLCRNAAPLPKFVPSPIHCHWASQFALALPAGDIREPTARPDVYGGLLNTNGETPKWSTFFFLSCIYIYAHTWLIYIYIYTIIY